MAEDERYLSPNQIRELLSVSRSLAYEVARECGLIKFGRSVRVLNSSFQTWIKNHEAPPAPRASEGSAPKGAAPAPQVVKPIRPTRPRNRAASPAEVAQRPIRPTRPRT